MNYFDRWTLRVIAATVIMLPIVILLHLFNCIPEEPRYDDEPPPKILKSFNDQVPPRGDPKMKVTNPLMSQSAHGRITREIIFRRTPRGHSAYRYFVPKQPGTEAQNNHQILFSLLADRWNHLDTAARNYWEPYAQAARISRYNAYMSYNLRRLNPAQPKRLIAWWPNLVPAGDVLHDLTSNRKDGEFVNLNPDTAWPYSDRRAGGVIQYDGTGFVNVPTPPSTTGSYTWAFWFKQNAYTATSAIVDCGHVGRYMHARFSAQRTCHVLKDTWAYSPQMFLNDFTWHHYAGTWQLTTMQIWIDGDLKQSVTQSVPLLDQITMHFGIHNVGVPAVGFRGQVDDLRFYNRFLLPDEIQELVTG